MTKRSVLTLGLVTIALLSSAGSGCRYEVNNLTDVSGQTSNLQTLKKSNVSPPIKWDEVAAAYNEVTTYVCIYEKVEQAISKGELQTIRLSFRKPFDVRLEWLSNSGKVDQTAVYRSGANNGKLLVRVSGFGSLFGLQKLDPNESLALEDSRHPITEVGLGKLIEHIQQDANTPGITSAYLGEETLDDKPAYRFEFIANGAQNLGALTGAKKVIVWVDRGMKLPVKVELYSGSGALLERHRFRNLVLNPKLPEQTFAL